MEFHKSINSSPRYSKIDTFRKHQKEGERSTTKLLLIGDSLITNLNFFKNVWNDYFLPSRALNFGISGDKIGNVLWRIENYSYQASLSHIFFLFGTSNIEINSPTQIVDGIIRCCHTAKQLLPLVQITVIGLLLQR